MPVRSLRRQLFAALALAALALAAPPAAAQTSPAAGPDAESRAVIQGQLDAFGRDAWAEAFAFASPALQLKFQNPQRFSEMVRGGYPMVWRRSSAEFLGAEQSGEDLIQRLRIVDAAGVAYIALYRMRRIDGAWRIAGVFIRKDDVGV